MTKAELDSIKILPLEDSWYRKVKEKLDGIAKPLDGLGKFEHLIAQIGAIEKTTQISIQKKAVLVMCADNGVVEEQVSQSGKEVTLAVAKAMGVNNSSVGKMAAVAGVDVIPVDIGIDTDELIPGVLPRKVAKGTKNFAKEPAMTEEEVLKAIETGIQLVQQCHREGYEILATGEMGIGNTTTSSAVASVLLGDEPAEITGRGAGLTNEGLERKIHAIEKAIAVNRPKWDDPVDVLAKVGGFDLAGITGLYLGGAVYRIPIVVDGFISAVAALAAVRICEWVKDAMIVSHVSKEPGMQKILKELHMDAPLHADMCLGEGTGAVAYLPVLDLAAEVYGRMSTFSENDIEDYKELGEKE